MSSSNVLRLPAVFFLNPSTPIRLFFWLVLALGACSVAAHAQANPNEDQGLKPYDSLHGGDLDNISLTNGGLTLRIPLVSFPQRGNLDLSFSVRFNNKQWYVKPARCCDALGHIITPAQWLPMPGTGVQIVSSMDFLVRSSFTLDPPDPNIPGSGGSNWSQSVSSPDGATHVFGNGSGSPLYPMRSLDAAGLVRPNAQTVITPGGIRYTYSLTDTSNTNTLTGIDRGGAQPTSAIDANGNQITVTSSGWTDTLGRVLPGSPSTSYAGTQPGVSTTDLSKCPAGTASAMVWNVPGPASTLRAFYFCYSNFTLSTNFTDGAAQNYGPTNTSLLSALVLPDLTMWTFSYDNYGDVTHVGFPTGGSLAYTYGIGPLNSGSGTAFSTWVMSRTVDANDGKGGHLWKYNYQGNFSTGNGTAVYPFGTKGLATVTTPEGNDTVYTVGPGQASTGCPGYVYQVQSYQGSSASGTLLKTIQNQYDCTMGIPGGNLDGLALNVVPTQAVVIFPAGQTARTNSAYDATFNDPNGQAVRVGSLLQKDDYDFSGTLYRSTLTHYLWQDNTNYLNADFIGNPVYTLMKDSSGCELSKTSYGYDETFNGIALQSSGVTMQHGSAPAPVRGNPTSTSKFLISGCVEQSAITSHTIFYDTGTPYQSFDPLLHMTQFTYDPAFNGAYVTQTNLPDTQMPDNGAPLVHHVVSGSYDFNTGLISQFTDENGRIFTYNYDSMLRLKQSNHPDGGSTVFNYPDVNTVDRQRLVSGTAFDDFKIKFDGLGRLSSTLWPTPGGTVQTDTTYDSMGRVATVSNPYYQGVSHTSDPTYGVTQNIYDALDRTTQTIKQDGSSTGMQYNTPAGDGSGTAVVCNTATDEAGKQRQTCTDALGRLVKVIEPNPGAVATFATGSFSVSGSEQSAQSQPAQAASVTVTIGGSDRSNSNTVCTTTCTRVCTTTCHTTTFRDSGSISFTVTAGGSTIGPVSATYNGSSSPATLASALYSAFPANAQVSMSNPNGGNSFTLTAVSGAAGNNDTISTSMASGCIPSDTMSCAGVGWTMTLSGPNLAPTTAATANFTGGQNASTIPDSGTVSANISGTVYTVTYGANDTSATIAANLAAAINSGSLATASVSGSAVGLTSKIAGTAGDYSLSGSYTWNSNQFVSPSFTIATSGAITGAKDASAINNNPYVTTYQYNPRGDLLCVHQKATDTTPDIACTGTSAPAVPAAWRQRFYTYDSLSRLLTASNPESNNGGNAPITNVYDSNNNLISRTEPAPNQGWGISVPAMVTMNYTYDALNRLLDTTYTGSTTQNSSHRYDYAAFFGVTIENPVGREVGATAANGSIAFITSYDPMGRVKKTVQCVPGVSSCQTFLATYDFEGNVRQLTYPANAFTLTYAYDSAARLTGVSDSNGVVYAQNPVISPNGAMSEFVSPGFNNFKYHIDYNSRLQPVEIWAGTAKGATALFDKTYQYNPLGASAANNGNLYGITNVKDATRSQTFTYDPLNRLVTAGDNGHWSNSYLYDAWGNLQKTPGSPAGENFQHAADGNNHLIGYSYDAAGNLLNDGINSFNYGYDAEYRLISAGTTTYLYDAGGRRIQKSTGTTYWYGPTGGALAETDSSGHWTFYVFFAGKRLARNVPQPAPNSADIKYYVDDHLHSTAIFADKSGTVLDDNDFYPWGGLVQNVGTHASNNTILFTGKYRDKTGLDYFGARFYSSTLGRWMRPDAPFAGQHPEIPQSWNLYIYGLNSPETYLDQNGFDVNKAVVALAVDQMDNLNFGDRYTIVNLGINSGPNTPYMATGTAQAVPSFSGHYGLGDLDTSVHGNTIVVPNGNGYLRAFFGMTNQDQIDTDAAIIAYAQSKGLQLQLMTHSNGVNDAPHNLPAGTFVNALIIAPNTSSKDTLANIIDATSGQATILMSDKDSALKVAWFGHMSVADLVKNFGDNDHVLIIQSSQSGHGAQFYSPADSLIIIMPITQSRTGWWYFDPNDSNAFNNWLACLSCQVSPFFQPIFPD